MEKVCVGRKALWFTKTILRRRAVSLRMALRGHWSRLLASQSLPRHLSTLISIPFDGNVLIVVALMYSGI